MRRGHSRRGSALLIVLGMLSFIVISAVAFSAYMRYSRMPSSYLRRTSASRHLAHAALAEAIDIIDASIGNDPHPGRVPNNNTTTPTCYYPGRDHSQSSSKYPVFNAWKTHVYVGTNNTLLAQADTVSTLNLESLAFLPPPLINEARYYSRHSVGGVWHSLNYDAGRFAFCAVDVSNYIDINRVPANVGRSSLPETRFSLAHVFENANHTGFTSGVAPSAWDQFMENFVNFSNVKGATADSSGSGTSASSKVPLVSLADFNLALNDKLGNTFAQYLSPFCAFMTGGASDFVTDRSGAVAEVMRRATIITDSWYPPAPKNGSSVEDYDLSDDAYQPFPANFLVKGANPAIKTIIDYGSTACARLRDKISRLGLVTLYDYLDEDNVPVSLATPQVERTPMICGIKHTINGSQIQIAKTELPSGWSGLKAGAYNSTYCNPASLAVAPSASTLNQTRTLQYKMEYRIDPTVFAAGLQAGSIQATVAYPFRSAADVVRPDSFTLDGHVSLFLTTDNLLFRTGNASDILHMADDSSFTENAMRDGVINIPLTGKSCTISDVDDAESAVQDLTFMLSAGSQVAPALQQHPILTVTWQWTQTCSNVGTATAPLYQWLDNSSPARVDATCDIPALTASGIVDTRFTSSASLLNLLDGGGVDVTLRMAVWLRIKNGDGKTVDLVPACLMDDQNFNSVNNFQSMTTMGNTLSGKAFPIMRFDANSFRFVDQGSGSSSFDNFSAVAVDFTPKGVMCADPRWNWAPEHWFQEDSISKSTWLQNCGVGTGTRDEDIFMATSDAGYMQSIYELAFLPRLTNLESSGNNALYGDMTPPDDERSAWATQLSGCRNNGLMWTTYRPYARNGVSRDLFEFADGGFVCEGGGMKVNPYVNSSVGLMSAFANTPLDWWVASASDQVRGQDVSLSRDNVQTFNKKYAFCDLSGAEVRFAWGHLEQIAENFSGRITDRLNNWSSYVEAYKGDELNPTEACWQDAYDELFALNANDSKYFCGVDLTTADSNGRTSDELLSVDKKFLYGYWRDCFAARQQLFLVFVRAEPMMMGGGAVGQTPPQLGARAVALVWRDPSYAKSMANDETTVVPPHRTRILFYHPLE